MNKKSHPNQALMASICGFISACGAIVIPANEEMTVLF